MRRAGNPLSQPWAWPLRTLAWLLTSAWSASAVLAGDGPPNIILLLADDQGWTGTSVLMDPAEPLSRSDYYQTPNLESLAAAGMRFSNAYSAAPVCSPTRAAILTGKSPAQLQFTDVPLGPPPQVRAHDGLPLTPPTPEPLRPSEVYLPQWIKQANPNYVTAHFGKWHVDLSGFPFQDDAGFDVYANPQGNATTDPKSVFGLTNLANNFMTERVAADEPFYLQVSHRAVHDPIEAQPATVEKYENLPPGTRHYKANYAAMTEDLDTSIGLLLAKVQELGIEDNTYIIYASDNGAVSGSSNFPLFRWKATLWEGGVRVPMIVRGPGIAPGSVSSVPVTSVDLFTTIGRLTGNEAPLPSGVEGGDLRPVLTNGGVLPEGSPSVVRAHADGGELFFHYPHNFAINATSRVSPVSAVRDGDYKLVKIDGENGNPAKLFLFNLSENITESSSLGSPLNLASALPEKTAELHEKLNRWLQDVDASLAYDVAAEIELQWDAGRPGADHDAWRSTIDVDHKARETWWLGEEGQRPELVPIDAFQPRLPGQAYAFGGDDLMTHKFFHVADAIDRLNTIDPGVADEDNSVTVQFWVRFDALDQEQILFESGNTDKGLSITVGDADGDGRHDDVRLRATSDSGNTMVVTAELDRFANPTRDFVHLAAVFNDDPNGRRAEIYVNGAVVGQSEGVLGPEGRIHWDAYDAAALGGVAGTGLGGAAGAGELPFVGGSLRGQVAGMAFSNHALPAEQILDGYNQALSHVAWGLSGTTGDVRSPAERPGDVSEGAGEADQTVLVIQERNDELDDPLFVDVLTTGEASYGADGILPEDAGVLDAGTQYTSYLLHFDPQGGPSMEQHAFGSVTFLRPILGILTTDSALTGSDALLGSMGRYPAADRALDFGPGDLLGISADLRTLTVSLHALGSHVVQLRVLTEQLPQLAGDMNLDGTVDFDDIEFFVLGLQDPSQYEQLFGLPALANGDTDADGSLDFDDIDNFVQILTESAAQGAIQAVPEPAAESLLVVAAVVLAGFGFSRRAAGLES